MSLGGIALVGSQATLGLAGLAVGGAKVTHQEDQVDDFQRFGYPQWFRVATGIIEILSGIGLLAGLVWHPGLALVGGLLLSGVMVGAIITHVHIGDPLSKTAVPAFLLALTAALLAGQHLVQL
ncbi:DoxX family protein [Halopenitus salinus]|uniref:DoxX family protein n=1 Tax=Halopenitus salinus TaxID=1198295 RepID=A0ABD5UQ16_9EURY